MRTLAIAAVALAFGSGAAFAECGWATAAKQQSTVVAKSDQASTAGDQARQSQLPKKAESEG